MTSLSRSSSLRGITGLLALALLLTGCQTDTTQQNQQTQPELPENELAIEDPWVRPASPGDSTALYMTIANGRSSADTLLGAQQAPAFASVQLFSAPDTAGMTQPIDSLVVPARARTHLAPDSAHVVLNNLNQSLSEGGTLLVTLDFAQSGLQQIQAAVRTSPPGSQQ